ncbi:amino acid adenylation domain-containing protein [Pseudomonas sp. B21-053]|uniref:amino acid adenylation domain-containing protein n=1 Tax=Pseudomonas sp. B21-053 TaxID=2895493 RepID=UPI0039B72E93
MTQAVDQALSLRLRAQARRLGVGAASLVHLAWAQVLGMASGQPDVVFGTVLMGRMQGGEGADRALGMFINTLPIRVQIDAQNVRAAVTATHARLTGLLGHEHASLALAQRCSGVAAPAPLFSALLNYRHSSVQLTDEVLSAWSGMHLLASEERTNYPLTLNVDDLGQGFSLTAQVEAQIGAQRVCGYMQVALESLVHALEHAPHSAMRDLAVLPMAERQQLLETWNAPTGEYAHDSTIHGLFEAQASAQPDAVAVVFGDQSLTYGELNARANQVAHRLLSSGIRPDDRVAICVERGVEMIVGLLGILKSGAGYVPLDPAYPAERIAYMLEDSTPVAILVHAATRELLAEESVRVIDLDCASLHSQSTTNPPIPELTSAHLAYVIYTSGSTGLPKGVMVEHRNVARLFTATQAWFDFGPQDVWALFHSFAFDFSVWEIWGALTHGGRLLVVPQATSRSPDECYALLCEAGVTVLNQTPSAFRQLIAAQGENPRAHNLRQVIFGGEALEPGLLKPWYARAVNDQTQLVNMYGITETTVHVTYRPLTAADAQRTGASPIGGRIPDLQLYILNPQREPVPVGVIGEMYVGGAGVARGYLNRDELTAERFLSNPFSTEPNARMYRTGDLGRWLVDGTVEYLGRNDEQVKIRGFRIELGEIQATLATCAGVSEALVIAREDAPGDKRLVAYVIAEDGAQLSATELRAQLLDTLADYMVPSAFVTLTAFPLTANGKLDRKALPAPDQASVASQAYAAPQGIVETTLASIWQELLDLEQIGRHDNFFELGGHSLLAVKLIERMRHAGLSADVRVLFGQPTLAALAAAVGGYTEVIVPLNRIAADCQRITPDMLPLARLEQSAIDHIVSMVPGGVSNVQDIYPLAPLQEGILYHHLAAAQGDPYLQYVMFGFDSFARLNSFSQALQAVVARHDILRTGVLWEGLAEPMQVVWRDARLVVEAVELEPVAGDIATQLHQQFDPRHYRLDIREAPMMRIAYAQDTANQRWVGILLFHHLVDDATSLAVLASEIEAHMLGQAQRLPMSVPYRNYVAQARLGVSREAHEAFFRDMLGEVDEPTLPFGLQDVQGDGSGIEEVREDIDADLSRRLRVQARQLGVSAASLYHLVWAQVLAKVSGRDDVVFGTVLIGRMQAGEGADRALGMFINTLPLRVQVGEQAVRAGVKATHKQLTALLGHEHASLVLAQRCSGVAAPTPLFSALLNYRHTGAMTSKEALSAWNGIELLSGEERTNYPLTLSVDDQGESFSFTVMTPARIGAQRICGYVQQTLQGLIGMLEQTPDAPLHQLSILPTAESEQLRVTFNATERDYPRDLLIHELIEQQVARRPEACAVSDDSGDVLTYAALNRRANQVAHQLIELGVGPDARVAVCLRRSPEMVIALLAILKAGGAYVPIDPDLPDARREYMLDDSAPLAVLSSAELAQTLPELSAPVLVLDRDSPDFPDTNPQVSGLNATHLAYVLYTSGSTGMPKGVMNEHRGVVNRLLWARDEYRVDETDRVLQKTPFGFDVSVWEFFLPLLAGAQLVMARPGGHQEPDYIAQTIRSAGITLLHFVPSMLELFLERRDSQGFPGLRRVLCSGEALPRSLQKRFEQQLAEVELHNLYGPTEAAIDVTAWQCRPTDQGDSVPIGRPIANIQIHILDNHGAPTPLGIAGEINIGGVGVARGYLNLPELSAERFVADPFSSDPHARLYKTGDLGRWLPDGSVEYLGRNDFQVKIRGFRIELGEIEAKLANHPEVKETVVLAREDVPGEKRLVAYYTTPGGALEVEILRSHLQSRLPTYMVPAAYVHLEALPLTANGKLDRKALPAPDLASLITRGYEAPIGDTEITLAQLWAEVLNVERVGRHDHFFELGGHSLLAVSLMERMRQEGLEADVRTLFEQPTLSEYAATTEKMEIVL